MSGKVLTTRRSVLRPLSAADEGDVHELWTSPGVRRYLWDDEVISLERTREALAANERLFSEREFGLWGVWPEASSALSGFAGLWPFRDPPELELVYGVSEPLWSRGYATEIADAVIGYWFDVLEMPDIRASTDVANAASVRVLQKLQFALVRQATINGLDTLFYERRSHGVLSRHR